MHLSSEKISQWIAGDATPGDREHMQVCSECCSEAGKLQDVLSRYSGFARDLGRRQAPAAPSLEQLLRETRRPARVARGAGVAATAAAAILVLLFPEAEQPRTPPPVLDHTVKDALLLQQVNARISRTAPLAMEPLLVWMEEKKPVNAKMGEEQ